MFSCFISELRSDGLWACPKLSSYSWWGCEYNMYLCWQNYLQVLGEVDVCELYYWPARHGLHPSGALALICLWVLWHGWLTLMGCSVKMMWLLESLLVQFVCKYQFVGLDNSTHICLWLNCHIIKRQGSHAWYWCWTIKSLVEAEVLYDGFSVGCGGIAALLIGGPVGPLPQDFFNLAGTL